MFLDTILKDIRDQACRHIFKGMYCGHRGVNPYFFLQSCANTSQPSDCCAWGNLLGSLRSESCQQFPSWGRVIFMGRSLCSKSYREGTAQSCQHGRQILRNALWCNGPCKDKWNSHAFKNSNK